MKRCPGWHFQQDSLWLSCLTFQFPHQTSACCSPFRNCFQRKPQSTLESITRRQPLANHSVYSSATHVREARNCPNPQQCVKADSSAIVRPALFKKDRKGQSCCGSHLVPFIFALHIPTTGIGGTEVELKMRMMCTSMHCEKARLFSISTAESCIQVLH